MVSWFEFLGRTAIEKKKAIQMPEQSFSDTPPAKQPASHLCVIKRKRKGGEEGGEKSFRD